MRFQLNDQDKETVRTADLVPGVVFKSKTGTRYMVIRLADNVESKKPYGVFAVDIEEGDVVCWSAHATGIETNITILGVADIVNVNIVPKK